MRRAVLTAIACLSLLSLADCSRKPREPQPATANGLPTAAPEEQASGGGSPLSSSCNALPDKAAVEKAIRDALGQIYGPDEAGVKVAVSAMTPDAECKTVTVRYKASGTAATVPMTSDGAAWSLTLYNKQYPVR